MELNSQGGDIVGIWVKLPGCNDICGLRSADTELARCVE